MKNIYIFLLFSALALNAFAQPTGDTFPDFTETDIDGVEHTLSDYLADDKVVVIDVFATWCSICTNSLPGIQELENIYGDQLVVLSFEKDPNTTNEASWASTHSITTPIFANSTEMIASWNVFGQPNFFVVCPDGSFHLKQGGIGSNPDPLAELVDICLEPEVMSIEEETVLDFKVLSNPVTSNLVIESTTTQGSFEIYGLTGELYQQGILEGHNSRLDVSELSQGIYFVKLSANGREAVRRFVKH